MSPRVAVVQFPGVNCETETRHALSGAGLESEIVPWTAEPAALGRFDAYVLPGGFSYQDRVRAGAVAARHVFLDTIRSRADQGAPVLGICNGAQILVESGLIPGSRAPELGLALAPNQMPDRSGYLARWVWCRVSDSACWFTRAYAPGEMIPLPMAHGEGRFETRAREDWEALERTRAVALRYQEPPREAIGASAKEPPSDAPGSTRFPWNPNGSAGDAAGISNPRGHVFALMPHPERAQWLAQVPLDLAGPWGERRRRVPAEDIDLWGAGPGAGIFLSLAAALNGEEVQVRSGRAPSETWGRP